MTQQAPTVATRFAIGVSELDDLLEALRKDGREVIGPTVRDGAVVYDEIHSARELPWGWTDQQEAGRYRLVKKEDAGCFEFAAPPHSWKRFLHPPEIALWSSESGENLRFREEPPRAPRFAFLGVRPCDLRAIQIQDLVLLKAAVADHVYQSRREPAFIIAVHCSHPSATCFCDSMGVGPKAREGFDLALTEIPGAESHRFLLEVGSEEGARIVEGIKLTPAGEAALRAAEQVTRRAAAEMGRRLDTDGLKEALRDNLDHPRWQAIGQRCLACANCTMVCPTCFCTTTRDEPSLDGGQSRRLRVWDSCFNADFSYIHGGAIRPGRASRYRQWLTHKLAFWHDQFGVSGCVGCGRCITWCPVGIDLTAEVKAIREGDGRPAAARENADGKP